MMCSFAVFFCTQAHSPAVGVSMRSVPLRSSGGWEDCGHAKTLTLPSFPSQISFDELNSAVMSTDF